MRIIIFKVDAMTYENCKNGMFRVFVCSSESVSSLSILMSFVYSLQC